MISLDVIAAFRVLGCSAFLTGFFTAGFAGFFATGFVAFFTAGFFAFGEDFATVFFPAFAAGFFFVSSFFFFVAAILTSYKKFQVPSVRLFTLVIYKKRKEDPQGAGPASRRFVYRSCASPFYCHCEGASPKQSQDDGTYIK
ncbi:MAG: hypothetical protein HXY38_00495 [Chloroflexi bacterium]|nr:hypothetical protein [Chloroflexota bacterium]